MDSLAEQIDALASREGFPLVGIASAQDSDQMDLLAEWTRRGYHGEMAYLQDRREAYQHPKHVLENCRSVVMLAMPYAANPRTQARKDASVQHTEMKFPMEGQLGNYSVGTVDYHDFIRDRLNAIVRDLLVIAPGSRWRGVVDTAPLLERDYARRAGLGWIGKNTLLLNREWGSYFFLAALLTDIELPPTQTNEFDHCGSCTACLDACPTQAFVEPHVMNASRCISYLTIEYRGIVPVELKPQMQDWIFGCDVCQMVCPWNRKRQSDFLAVFEPEELSQKQSLRHWLTINEDDFRKLYKKRPFWRTKLRGMQRNALIAAGNNRRLDLLPLIEKHCESDEPTVADAANWAKRLLSS